MTQRIQRRRWLVGSLGIVAAGLAVASLSVPAAGQSEATAATGSTSGWTLAKHRDLVRKLRTDIGLPASWKTPRTSWGDPDLQGQWTSDSVHGVPRERSEQFAGRAFLTDAEYAERVKREAQTRSSAENASSPNTNGRDRAWRGNVTFRMTSMIMDPPDGRIPPLTPEAQSRPVVRGTWGAGPHNGPEDFTLYDRCITRGIVGSVLPVSYGNGNTVIQTPNQVVIAYEMIHDTRVIPTDGRAHIGPHLKQYLGNARGRWDGETLIVETTNFTDKTSIGANGNGLRHSDALRMTERLTRMSADFLLYDVTVDDPKTYARPWTMVLPLIAPTGFENLPYECHEGNGAVKYTLSAARKYDTDVNAAIAKGLPPPPPPPCPAGISGCAGTEE
jgi:hypothetical protein